jgi:diguanylate cyclase (GGDEF)-like protein
MPAERGTMEEPVTATGDSFEAALAGAATVDQAAAAVCDHLLDVGMPMPSVYVEVAGRLRCVAQRGYWQVHDGVPPEVGILGATFRSGIPSIIRDVRLSPDFVAAGQGVVGEVTFPFRHGGGVVGCVNVESPRALERADVDHVRAATAALERWLDVHDGVPVETAWQRLARESAALAQLHDHRAIARLAVERATQLTGMTSAVLVTDEAGDVRRVAAAFGPLAPALRTLEPATLDAIAGWTSSGASVYTFGSFPVQGFSGSAQVWDAGIQALVSVPVMGPAGARGFLLAADGTQSQPGTDDVQVLELFAAHLAIALQGADAFVELRRQASRDTLTGLGHGAVLHALLEERLEAGGADLVVLLIDLDDFKVVNDSNGHLFGDQVLIELARSFEAHVGPTDRVFRIGGDEFAALVSAADDADAVAAAERLRAAAAAGGHLTVSVGVRRHDPHRDGGCTADRLMADADLALYQAKADGRNQVQLYRPAMRRALLARAQLAAELATAVDGELYLDYQPLVDLRTGAISGAEALIRWQHPRRGLVMPDGFIAVAEEDGQIAGIGSWVVATAAAQAAAWRRATGLPLTVSVNVSGTQLRPGFVEDVRTALERADLPPDGLVAEITESALVDEAARVEVLAALRALGVRIAVDDFGTGYSSLSYLRRLPIDIVKIDRSFVSDLSDRRNAAVAKAIIDLAHTLDLGCVAEGVETAEQAAQLRQLGCGQAQGYLFCRPTTPAHVLELVGRAQGVRAT